MDVNWTTLLLEIVNFLILVWILKRFLYQPVLHAIQERRARVQATLEQAQAMQEQAQQLRGRFERRLAEWEEEKQTAREAFQRETELQRKQALQELEETLAAAREKRRVVEERGLLEQQEQKQRQALELAARFAARLLEELAGPELEERILHRFQKDLKALSEAELTPLQRATENSAGSIQVESAFVLDAGLRQRLEQMLRSRFGDGIRCSYRENPELIAGLRLSLGDWVLAVNLRDELKGFLDIAREND